MAAQSINLMFRCEDCTFADAYGRSCKHWLLFPVLLLMAGAKNCPNFQPKTKEQTEEQMKIKEK